MKKILFLLLFIGNFVFGQQFSNIGFESTSCINDCDPLNGQMTCVSDWWSDYTQGIVPLKNVNCDPDLVCNGNNSVLLVSTSGSPGSSIRTNNPFFGFTLQGSPIINLTVNKSSQGHASGGIRVIGRYAGQNNWDELGFASPQNTDVCESISIVLDESVTDYEELSFFACTASGTCHGGLGNYIVVDDIQVVDKVLEIRDNCGKITVAINPELNLDVNYFGAYVTSDPTIFDENSTGNPLMLNVGTTGTFPIEVYIGYEVNGQTEFLIYNVTHTVTDLNALPATITADGTDITNALTYTIPCGESCVTLNATNLENAVYNTSDPVLNDLNGLFCVTSDITSFTATITGIDSCGDPYTENVTVNVEQDCCLDEPYVEPHWELCETNNVCELESWPIRVLDDDGSPLLLIDGYTFSWTLNGTEISNSDILYGAVEDETYEVTVTYPDGCVYTISYLEVCCVPDEVTITADGIDITDTLTYTIPCGESCVTINATNVDNAVYNTSDPVLTDLNGLFCVTGNAITSFTANITGLDSCGDPYSENVTVIVEQDCCLDDISVIFDECPDEDMVALGSSNTTVSKRANTIVSAEDAANAITIMKQAASELKDCDPCESGVVSTTVVDGNGDPITSFQSIYVSWAANPTGVNVNTNPFLVYVDVQYTVTVTVIDPEGHECIYTYDFIYECDKGCENLPAPTNLQNNGSTLSWDPVPGAVSYIVSSPSVINISCCIKSNGVSIAPITTTTNSVALPISLQSSCFVWQVTAVCEDGSTSPVSNQACHLPTRLKSDDKQEDDSISIYPNPTKGYVDIKVDLKHNDHSIRLDIYRHDGLLVKTVRKAGLDNEPFTFGLELNLPSGLYLFNFKTESGIVTKRVIID